VTFIILIISLILIKKVEFKIVGNFFTIALIMMLIIKIHLPIDGFVTLKVYSAIGELVTELINENQTAGQHQLNFNANTLPSGIYFAELRANDNVQRIKMMLVK